MKKVEKKGNSLTTAVEDNTEEIIGEQDNENEEVDNIEEQDNDVIVDADSVEKFTSTEEVKQVKIKMKEDHNCFIGGQWYNLKKNTTCNVPQNVKSILSKAGLLLPL